jgi:hypothetical protein
MQRRRFKDRQLPPLHERLSEEARRLREKAKTAREALIRKARQAETGSHLTEWLSSPGRRAPA